MDAALSSGTTTRTKPRDDTNVTPSDGVTTIEFLGRDGVTTIEFPGREDEAFSEAVKRIARERPISDLAGLFADDDVEEMRDARANSDETYANRRKREQTERYSIPLLSKT